MSDYLSKEEIKQWRGSLERITLEEYALRLGKKINTEKETNDMADAVLSSPVRNVKTIRTEERQLVQEKPTVAETPTPVVAKVEEKPIVVVAKTEENVAASNVETEMAVEFKKALTDREQAVFDYFAKNKGKTVFAKDLASLLNLPRDYVYKYIKNLRSKLANDVLENSEKGGYRLNL